jgi:hypothetical protein
MMDTIVHRFADGTVEAHPVLLVLFRAVHEEAVFADRLAVFEKRTAFFIRDVDDMARELEIGAFFTEVVGKPYVFLVFLHVFPDIKRIEMRSGKVDWRPSIKGFFVRDSTKEQTLHIDELAEGDVWADGALVFREDDGLVFPCEGNIVFELVEQNVLERVDLDVLRSNDLVWSKRLIELRKLVAVIHEHAEDRILVLAVRHVITSCPYFTMIP